MLNVPPYATTDCLKYAFANLCGNVQSVTFSSAKGFKTAYIVFTKESSLDKAMELPKDCVITLNSNKNVCLTGLESELYLFNIEITFLSQSISISLFLIIYSEWCKEYNDTLCDEQLMKKEIEEYITSYDEQVKNRIAQEKAAEEKNEGWITVTGGKKRGQFAPTRKESTIGKVQQKEEQRRKKKQLLNFYTFQIRETKKQSKYNCALKNFFF